MKCISQPSLLSFSCLICISSTLCFDIPSFPSSAISQANSDLRSRMGLTHSVKLNFVRPFQMRTCLSIQ
uniref:Putative secreted protein n=1 Tax=Anopheles marajoara TaxID=58244 RepID=A0A2M4CEZ9_9DIPT